MFNIWLSIFLTVDTLWIKKIIKTGNLEVEMESV